MIYLFDTSGINRLHDDPSRDAILAGLVSTNKVWISALNVAEVGQTVDHGHRTSLLNLLKAMTGDQRPLEFPTTLIQHCIKAYSQRLPGIDITICEKHEDILRVLIDPSLLDEFAFEIWSQPLRKFEEDFLETHRSARPHFQNLFEKSAPTHSPKSAPELLRAYMSNEAFLNEIVNPIYRKVVGADLPVSDIMHLLRALPQLTGFLLSWGHSIYRRSIASSGYGKRNAGNVDIWFAAYLAHVDRFITNDLKQYQALRMVTRIFAPKCEVLKYDSFRRRLVIEARP